MLKKKIQTLVAKENLSEQSKFEIIYDGSAIQIMGGKADCPHLTSCGVYGNDQCAALQSCGTFKYGDDCACLTSCTNYINT